MLPDGVRGFASVTLCTSLNPSFIGSVNPILPLSECVDLRGKGIIFYQWSSCGGRRGHYSTHASISFLLLVTKVDETCEHLTVIWAGTMPCDFHDNINLFFVYK